MQRALALLILALPACATEPAPAPAPATSISAPGQAALRPARRQAPGVMRVTEDGITGCADRATLQKLRDAPRRSLAVLRAEGGCVTVFRASAWRQVEAAPDALRLEPVDGTARPGALWFRRDQVAEERP